MESSIKTERENDRQFSDSANLSSMEKLIDFEIGIYPMDCLGIPCEEKRWPRAALQAACDCFMHESTQEESTRGTQKQNWTERHKASHKAHLLQTL